jgi:hypothetical protein
MFFVLYKLTCYRNTVFKMYLYKIKLLLESLEGSGFGNVSFTLESNKRIS